MTRLLPSTLLLALLWAAAALPAANAQDLAIRNVTTLDPASGRVEAGRTVLVDGGVVVSVGAELPDGASPERSIDGAGRFMIPGLWDMHVHLDMHTDGDVAMLVTNGVLNVRDMGGDPIALAEIKARIADGELVGPTVRGAGAILEDRRWLTRARQTFPELEHRLPVDNPAEARAMVSLLDSWGVDLIKVRNVAGAATFAAILEAAGEHGLTVAGHEPRATEIDEAARLGMTTFEHLPFIGLTMPGREADAAELERVIAGLAESGAYVTPTLIASRKLGWSREERAAAVDRPDDRYRYLSKAAKRQWIESLESDAGPLPWGEMYERSLAILRRMHGAGIPILAGTDTGVPLTFPGFALHDELGLMVDELGLEPLEALRTATSNPAALFDAPGGSIAPGMAADLLLLSANPLTDIGSTGSIEAVILRGELLDSTRLAELRTFAREHRDSAPRGDFLSRLEAACRAEATAACLERLAGYRFSLFRYAEARATYRAALDAGAGASAFEGWFSSTVNALHDGDLDCPEALATTEAVLDRRPLSPADTLGVLDRMLAATTATCPSETASLLTRLARVDPSTLGEPLSATYREHYASYLAHVENDPEAALDHRVSRLPEGWRDDPGHLGDVATWCLDQDVALERARELARRATERAPTPIGRLEMMMLEARIASANGEHADAIALMETIDEAVPNNQTVTGLLEEFRRLAAAGD